MKKNLLRTLCALLILVLLLGAFAGLALSESDPGAELPLEIVFATAMKALAGEGEIAAENAEIEMPAAGEAPAASEEPAAPEEPAATEKPADDGMTTSPVDSSTTLSDGEYVPTGCTGGSAKVSFSCPLVTVSGGKATATLVISSSKYDYVKAGGSKYATEACAGGVCAKIPVDLNVENRIVAHTTAMGGKEIEYSICISLSETVSQETPAPEVTPVPEISAEPTEEPGEDTEHTVETDNKMFKIVRSVLTKKDGKYSAQIVLSGTGYDKLYMGTAEQAANDSANWIAYSGTYDYTNDSGEVKTGYLFNIPVAEVNAPISVAAFSTSKSVWYDRKVTFTVAIVDPTVEPTATVTPTVSPSPTPSATPVIVPTPGKVNSSTTLADGTYTPDKFSWSGGSGRTSISCSKVTVKGGKAYATIAFSSDSYGYVKANGSKYYGSVIGGKSTFEIPVKLNANNTIVGMTSAMSADHEIAYTIYVYIAKANESAGGTSASPEAEVIGLTYLSEDTIDHSELFKVYRYEGGYTVIDVQDAGKYLLVPENAEIPVGVDEGATLIQKPVKSLYAADECAQAMLAELCALLPEDSVTLSAGDYAAIDYASLLKNRCDVAVMPEIFAEAPGRQLSEEEKTLCTDVRDRLELLDIALFVDRSADEETQEAKLEWIKVYGILLGCEDEAKSCYAAALAELEAQA